MSFLAIDITTSNNVYDSLSIQGQWIQHRFGRRNYPSTELPQAVIIQLLCQFPSEEIKLVSNYGDPLLHSGIKSILHQRQGMFIETFLNVDKDIAKLCKETNQTVYVKLSGIEEICTVINLHSDWNQILTNLEILGSNAIIDFSVYEHNYHQLEAVIALAKKNKNKLKISKGIALTHAGSSVINEEGIWLYDVVPVNYSLEFLDPCNTNVSIPSVTYNKTLAKKIVSYKTLITYAKETVGRSILHKPLIPKMLDFKRKTDNNYMLTVTGHLFNDFNLGKTFTCALCSDWLIDHKIIESAVLTNDIFLLNTIKELQDIAAISLEKTNILTNSLDSILNYFSNRNV